MCDLTNPFRNLGPLDDEEEDGWDALRAHDEAELAAAVVGDQTDGVVVEPK
jgi:hypothetical protein